MIYRLRGQDRIVVTDELGDPTVLDPATPYDDADAHDAKLIARWRDLMVAENSVEAATAAPGERRSTRRKPAA